MNLRNLSIVFLYPVTEVFRSSENTLHTVPDLVKPKCLLLVYIVSLNFANNGCDIRF